jgi:hypothetical protein
MATVMAMRCKVQGQRSLLRGAQVRRRSGTLGWYPKTVTVPNPDNIYDPLIFEFL